MPRALGDNSTIDMQTLENIQAIRRRLRLAFPEVSKCFPYLSQVIHDGEGWPSALDTYTLALPRVRLEALCVEVRDLFVMGWSKEQFAVVVSDIFGLAADVVAATGTSAWQFVGDLDNWLQALDYNRNLEHRSGGELVTLPPGKPWSWWSAGSTAQEWTALPSRIGAGLAAGRSG